MSSGLQTSISTKSCRRCTGRTRLTRTASWRKCAEPSTLGTTRTWNCYGARDKCGSVAFVFASQNLQVLRACKSESNNWSFFLSFPVLSHSRVQQENWCLRDSSTINWEYNISCLNDGLNSLARWCCSKKKHMETENKTLVVQKNFCSVFVFVLSLPFVYLPWLRQLAVTRQRPAGHFYQKMLSSHLFPFWFIFLSNTIKGVCPTIPSCIFKLLFGRFLFSTQITCTYVVKGKHLQRIQQRDGADEIYCPGLTRAEN